MLLPLVSELSRRRVFRALVGYGVAAFAVLQIIEPVMHGLRWPDAVLSYVVVGLAAGFPLVVTLAWVFDVKAGRIERTAPAPAGGLRGSRLALILVGVGALAAAPGLIWYFVWPGRARSVADAQPTTSVAVVPFVNMSSDKENEYFSDGITEELVNALANVEGLRVASRTSVFALKGKGLDARQIGERLNVNTLLEGSVRREGNALRVTAQLINVADDVHMWSNSYDRELKSVFAVEDEIARSIVQTLRRKLVGGKSTALVKPSTVDLEAHDLYLRGRYFLARRAPEPLRRAAGFFQQAIDKDPAYTLAWVGLADATALQNEYDEVPPSTVLPRAKQAALRALELDAALAEAYASLAVVHEYEFDWAASERELRRAIELKPDYPSAHHWLSLDLSFTGRIDDALAEAERALQLDPTSLVINNLIGVTRLFNRDFEGAIAAYKRTLDMDPGFALSHGQLGLAYAMQGRYDEADAEFDKGLPGLVEVYRGVAYALAGHRDQAARVLASLEERAAHGYASPAQRGLILVALGERERGYALLDQACAEHDYRLRDMKINPVYDTLRKDARFHDVLKCAHLE